jgi:predicted transposase YbfD/YdcC
VATAPATPAATDEAGDPIVEQIVEADAAHQAELTRAPALLAALPLAGRVVTGDALYCQRALCEQIRAAQGDYLFVVKANQPTLLSEVALLFDQPPPAADGVGFEAFAVACSHGRHGSRHEQRRLWASAALNAYLADLGWPSIGQVFRLERVCVERGVTTRQVRHFITSLPASISAQRLLELARGHWAIENRLHYVRDVTCGEDASTIRSGSAPEVMAALRSAHLALLRLAGWRNIAAAHRHYAWSPGRALRLLGLTVT